MLRELDMHPFTVLVLNDGTRIDRDAFARGRPSDIEATPTRTIAEAEFHALRTAFTLSHYLGALNQIVCTPAYITEYRRTRALARKGITRASDMVYHLEGFLVRVRICEDRALQLCSAVCHTGLAPNAVNFRTVSRNSIVMSTDIEGPLKELHKICGRYSEARNQVVHQHGYLDSDVRRVEAVLLASRVLPAPRRNAAAASYRFLVNELGRTKGAEIESVAAALIACSTKLLDAFMPQYQLRQRQLAVSDA